MSCWKTRADISKWPRPPNRSVPQAIPAFSEAPSAYLEMPALKSYLKPSNFLSSTKFTTPATASEPYTAEAPPVTTSTRVISIWGRTSTSVVPFWLDGATRLPSSRIRVRCAPRARRFSVLPELLEPPLFCERGVEPPMKSGSLFKASGISVGVVADSCSAVTTVNGVGDRLMSEMTREPVTVTASTLAPDSCARAAAVMASTLVAHMSASLLILWLCMVSP